MRTAEFGTAPDQGRDQTSWRPPISSLAPQRSARCRSFIQSSLLARARPPIRPSTPPTSTAQLKEAPVGRSRPRFRAALERERGGCFEPHWSQERSKRSRTWEDTCQRRARERPCASGAQGRRPAEFSHGVGLTLSCRAGRNRLADRSQIHARVSRVLPIIGTVAAMAASAGARRHGIRGLDRYRHHRYDGARHLSVRRVRRLAEARLHWLILCGIVGLKLTSEGPAWAGLGVACRLHARRYLRLRAVQLTRCGGQREVSRKMTRSSFHALCQFVTPKWTMQPGCSRDE
jgi:hypothetical protein